MGQDFSRNCCKGDVFIQEEDETTTLNMRRWKYINNELSITSNEMTTTQPKPIKKNNANSHPFKPKSNVAIRVEDMNQVSSNVKKILEKMRDFNLIKEREKLPVLGPYLYLNDKSTYYGQYNKGKRQGIGQCIWPDGSKYTGEWSADKMNGKGRLVTSDGDMYEGDFLNGMREGKGKLVLKDGKTSYSGGWENNQRDGTGIQKYPDGGEFTGTFKRGVRHGPGVYKNKSKAFKMKGNWKNGKRQGEFTTTVLNKEYIDNFENGKHFETNSKNLNTDEIDLDEYLYDDSDVRKGITKVDMKTGKIED